jgi:hypothetical protein
MGARASQKMQLLWHSTPFGHRSGSARRGEWWPWGGAAGSALHVQDTMGLVECGAPVWAEPLDIIM